MFGDEGLIIDQFFLTLGLTQAAEETWEVLPESNKEQLQFYTNGVNDYIDGVGMFKQDATASTFPPEFHVLTGGKVDPWSPIDTLVILKLVNFHLSFNWSQDLLREVLGRLEGG